MEGIKLNLAGLKDKVASKLQAGTKKAQQKQKKKDNKKKQQVKDDPPKEPARSENKPVSKPENNPEIDDLLRKEALELGATEDDLKLLQGVDEGEESEQEFNDDGAIEKGLSNDLSKFMSDIGLDVGKVQIVADDEVPELQEDDEEEQEEQVAEEEEEEEEEEAQVEQEDEIAEEPQEESEDEEAESYQEKVAEPVNSNPFTPEDIAKHKRVDTSSVVNTSRLLILPQINWYEIPIDLTQQEEQLSQDQIDKLFIRGKFALEEDNKIYYEEFSKSSSQRKFLSQILSDGTLSDKISALTLLIQEAPAHNLKSFETLLNFTNKKSRNSALQSINALKDLLVNGLLPDRKLRYFKNQPLSLLSTKKQLALFYFEDYLKNFYFQIIQVLERLCHDPIIHVRMNVVSHIFDLLKMKPEQEVNLLRLGVNKIGDIDNKVSAKTSYQILQLEQAHPNMKRIVIDAVIDTAFKKNTDYHTNYYSILTLNQTILARREDGIANELVKTYFALFEKLLIESDPHNADKEVDESATKTNNYKNRKMNFKKGKKGGKSIKVEKTEAEVIEEKNSKLFSALLTGLNRAFPFSKLPNEVFLKHLETLFKITHSSNFNTSIQALVLIHQIITTQKLSDDRFYRTLYESLFDTRLVTSSKQGIYLNLLFKSLKQDSNIQRVQAFVKRIVQICYNWLNIGSVAGMFYLLLELEKSVPQIKNLAINTPVDYKYESDAEENGEESSEPKPKKELPVYDGRKRDPRFANADRTSIWEINEFLNHYHPTVQLYAESFLTEQPQVKPDLGLFTLSHFLDRFVYRNAKQKPITKGSSIMQPLGGVHTGSLLVKATNKINGEIPANTEDWLSKKAEDIKPDEKFFHQYFISKEKDPSKLNENIKEDDFNEESDLDDEEVWDAVLKSQPELEGGLESDIDDFSDLDAGDFSDVEDNDEVDLEDAGNALDVEAEIDDDEDVGSDFEIQAIGLSDEESGEEEEEEEENDDEEEVHVGDDDSDIEDDQFAGFSESEDEEANLFKGDSEDEIESDEEAEVELTSSKKRALKEDAEAKPSKKKSRKSKFKELPTFASADDYAQYLDSDNE
jgi:ribosome biogenesis protein MAK21